MHSATSGGYPCIPRYLLGVTSGPVVRMPEVKPRRGLAKYAAPGKPPSAGSESAPTTVAIPLVVSEASESSMPPTRRRSAAAEHSARHAGQIVTLASVVRG